MNEALGMDVVAAAKELVDEHQDCLEGEFPPAKAEAVVQSGAEEITRNHRSVFALFSVPVEFVGRQPYRRELCFVDLGFALEQIKLHGVNVRA